MEALNRSVVDPLRKRFGLFSNSLGYPADFICEAIDQTRGWFYTLHAIGGIMGIGRAFKHVICLGHVLDARGKKMSKSQGNTVEPNAALAKYGADTIRYFMYSVNAPGDTKNFDERVLDEIAKKHIGRLVHVLAFYMLYKKHIPRSNTSTHVLDRWICARLHGLVGVATKGYEEYHVDRAVRPLADFIDDLSTWYVRRSRDRFKSGSAEEKKQALSTLYFVLFTLSKLIAPFMPFMAEKIYQELRIKNQELNKESVHLEEWPEANKKLIDRKLLDEMKALREVVSLCLEIRAKAGIPVRQVLGKMIINNRQLGKQEYPELLKGELNVEEVVLDEKQSEAVTLDTFITPELKEKGLVRELVRTINQIRKEQKLTIKDKIIVVYETENRDLKSIFAKYHSDISQSVLAREIKSGKVEDGKELLIGGNKITIKLII